MSCSNRISITGRSIEDLGAEGFRGYDAQSQNSET